MQIVYKIQSTCKENVNCILLFSSYVMRPAVNVNSIAQNAAVKVCKVQLVVNLCDRYYTIIL